MAERCGEETRGCVPGVKTCPICDREVPPQAGAGQPRRFCSEVCRRKRDVLAKRDRRRANRRPDLFDYHAMPLSLAVKLASGPVAVVS